MARGKTVRIFLVDGSFSALVTAEIMNWTGHVMAAPRSELASLLARGEAARTGVYFLIGEDPETGEDRLYIGEGDDVGRRVKHHAGPEATTGKDFWNKVIVVTSKDTNLTKAHARYLESELIRLARQAGRATLDNGTAPPLPTLSEADTSDMDEFLAQTLTVLPVLGLSALKQIPRQTSTPSYVTAEAGTLDPATVDLSPLFETHLAKESISAQANEVDGDFIVLAGSWARRTWIGKDRGYRTLHEQLEATGVLAPSTDDSTLVFTRDYAFSSPSAARSVIVGRASNGRTEWRVTDTGQTYAQWQAAMVDAAAPNAED